MEAGSGFDGLLDHWLNSIWGRRMAFLVQIYVLTTRVINDTDHGPSHRRKSRQRTGNQRSKD